jgi:hypothetical protein
MLGALLREAGWQGLAAEHARRFSDFHLPIWNYVEPAWREYSRQRPLRAAARRGFCRRGRLGRDADRVLRALGQFRPGARRLCRIRRGAGQLAAGRPPPGAARRAASVGCRAHRPAFRPRHHRTRRRARGEGGDGAVRSLRDLAVFWRAGRKGVRLQAGARRQGLLRRRRRLHLLSPAFHQHRDPRHPVRLLLECRLHLRDRRAREVDRQEPDPDDAHLARGGALPRGSTRSA